MILNKDFLRKKTDDVFKFETSSVIVALIMTF